jgi:phosphomevalonate kinase
VRRVLAISGKRFSGKDTLAEMIGELARSRGAELQTYAFANESKRMFADAQHELGVSIDVDRLSSDRGYKEGWRPHLTQFTVDAIAADHLVFVRRVAERIAADPRPALISDMRLRVEVEWLQSEFDLVSIRIVRANDKRAACGWTFDAAKDDHHTETELDDFDGWTETVVNQGSFEELNRRADDIVTAFLR